MAGTSVTVTFKKGALEKAINQVVEAEMRNTQLLRRLVIAFDACQDEEVEELIVQARKRFGFKLRDDVENVREANIDARMAAMVDE